MASTPDYLFRVWSSQSNGINTESFFAPASICGPDGCTRTGSITLQPQHATVEDPCLAFIGGEVPANRFLYFTDTLLYALQFAAQKKSDGWKSIRITCFCTSTVLTPDGQSVQFHSAPDLLRQYSVRMRKNRDGEKCSYEGEWVTIDCSVVPGVRSSSVELETLIQRGLYVLYPELGQQAARRRVHLYSALRDARKYCFGSGRSWALTEEDVDVVARLAGGS